MQIMENLFMLIIGSFAVALGATAFWIMQALKRSKTPPKSGQRMESVTNAPERTSALIQATIAQHPTKTQYLKLTPRKARQYCERVGKVLRTINTCKL